MNYNIKILIERLEKLSNLKVILKEAPFPPTAAPFTDFRGLVDFEKLITTLVPGAIYNQDIAGKVADKFRAYCNKNRIKHPYDAFKGLKKEIVNLSDLLYSQGKVENSGSKTNGPVFVIGYKGKLCLFDGYHRVADAALHGETTIVAKIFRCP